MRPQESSLGVRPVRDSGGSRGDDGFPPTVSSSIELLVAGSQGVITKRLDLAMLEGGEMLSRGTERAAWLGIAMILTAGAWFAAARAIVLRFVPAADPSIAMGAFALLNGAGAFVFAALATRRNRPEAAGGAPDPQRDQSESGRER